MKNSSSGLDGEYRTLSYKDKRKIKEENLSLKSTLLLQYHQCHAYIWTKIMQKCKR